MPTGLQLTPLDPGFRECPHKYLDRLRREDPVHRDTELGRVYLTRFEEVKAALFNRSFSSDPRKAAEGAYHRRAVIGDTPIEAFKPTMLQLDDPDHKRIRSLVSRAFTPQSVEEWRPRIREIAETLLRNLDGRDSFDTMAEYAAPLPIIVIAEMLGVDPKDLEKFKAWSDARIQLFNPSRTPEQTDALIAAQAGLDNYLMQAIEARRRQPGDDLVSALIRAEEAGQHLTTHEILVTCRVLLVAGNITTTDLIGNGVLAFLNHPEQLAKFMQSPDLVPNAVEEILRYDPPVEHAIRIAVKSTPIAGAEIQAGESITGSLLAAGRDPSVHQDPHTFEIERANTTHLAFGGGAHYCIGAPLARAEAQIALRLLFERFPAMRLDSQYKIEHKAAPGFNGLKALWVGAG